MLIVTGSMTARPDSFVALREAALAHTRRSRAEPGCISHAVHVDCENPLRLVFYEEWADRAALDVHFAEAGSLAFMKTVRDLSASSTRVKILPIVDRP
ncbi:MAG: antibiotic biosynthesis monooxygenase [Alphaproteobacteria bacterium]|nr:antibiotic biosynthesis monooxygenase [Alphaproteobacteria bacterium]MBU1512653.1 antibiotic biosynthesis monooxygenase [Alphaproteobacteria bacterium]MBU2095047.1 antibiotic biosynthesis monooxygenase [Alphaproteobacteria bacterium]MBU2151834.1 antibiotic biosynthesis monooxygenase [Alphaproteobacteria bacterium]MBU2306233.1 antibiotic biosynthesis monooxygenase [Alphaproteobacteria bacterium]